MVVTTWAQLAQLEICGFLTKWFSVVYSQVPKVGNITLIFVNFLNRENRNLLRQHFKGFRMDFAKLVSPRGDYNFATSRDPPQEH